MAHYQNYGEMLERQQAWEEEMETWDKNDIRRWRCLLLTSSSSQLCISSSRDWADPKTWWYERYGTYGIASY